MSLRKCAAQRKLSPYLQVGLKALGGDSGRVSVTAPRRVTHSIALDDALRPTYPNAARWDYGIGLSQGAKEFIAWVEVHTASSGEVDAVLKKLHWLRQWLALTNDFCTRAQSTFHWVATDNGVHIDSARLRKLNAAGLQMPKTYLRL